jgi:outer membrane lipoprotein-sorting protein
MPTLTVIRAKNLGDTMKEIRTWLDAEKIQPVVFKTVVSQAGIGFEISFRHEQEAEAFQQRFASLVPG